MIVDVDQALKFLLANRKKRQRDISQAELQEAVKVVEKGSLEGFTSQEINSLARKIVFFDCYNMIVRRRLLYCLMPKGDDFPLHLIPFAISSASVMPCNVSWQHAVLTWLAGMMEYGIIPPDHQDIRICYTSIFNLTEHLNLCQVACKILTLMTVREDVTSTRALILMRLKQKLGFFIPVSQILRLYQLFRPDLVAGELSDRRVVTRYSKTLQESLLAARYRKQQLLTEGIGQQDDNQIWPEITRVERVNMYQRSTAIPQPQIHTYLLTMEEKKQKMIYVTQFRRFRDMVRGIEEHHYWKWPSNPASHLAYPLIIPLFRPHDIHMQVNLTNWLEIALRTELTSNLGNPGESRRDGLLDAVLKLSRVTSHPQPFPVINQFITEFMITGWDQRHNCAKMLQLLEYSSFTSPEFLSETLLKVVGQLTSCVTLVSWCRAIEAVTATAGHWCFVAHEELYNKDKEVQPQELFHEKGVVGLWYLTRHLEKVFNAAVLTYNAHPLCLHHILDYYVKINEWSRELSLPAVFFPPVMLTLAIISSTDLTSSHRLGSLLASMREGHKRLQEVDLSADISLDDLRHEQLEALAGVNSAVRYFCGAVHTGKALTRAWEKGLDQFYPFYFLEGVRQRKNASHALAITHTLSYFPYHALTMFDRTEGSSADPDDSKQVLIELRKAGLTGIEECIIEYSLQ